MSVLNYETLAKEEGTLIFLMGLKNLPNIVASLIENGKDPATPVGVLQEEQPQDSVLQQEHLLIL